MKKIIPCILIICTIIFVLAIYVSANSDYPVTLPDMRARAEAIVNYTWVPSSDICVWNANPYNGSYVFKKGTSVVGMPYTLFAYEFGVDSLLSLKQYKNIAASNYSATKYCTSVGENRTGPVYGSCCATFVSEVFGGSYMSGDTPLYDGCTSIKNAPASYSFTGDVTQIQAGDALINTSGWHIIWIGEVTDTKLVIYEQAPPVARKITVTKPSSGYLTYNGSTYKTIIRSTELSHSAPTYAAFSTNKTEYAINETITFTMQSDGNTNTLWVYNPDGSVYDYFEHAGNSYQISLSTPGNYSALVESWNGVGSVKSKKISFTVYNNPDAPVVTSVTSYGSSVIITWAKSECAQTYDVYLVQAPWSWESIKYSHTGLSNAILTKTFDNVADGYYKAFVIARPNSDKVQSNWAEVTVDTSLPVITDFTVSGFSPYENNTAIFTINAQKASKYIFKIGNGSTVIDSIESDSNTCEYTFTKSGNYAIWGYAVNINGATVTSYSHYLTVDTSLPVIHNFISSKSSININNTVTFTINAEKAVNYIFKIGDGVNVIHDITTTDNTYSYTFTESGNYSIWGYAVNINGKTNTPFSLYLTVNTQSIGDINSDGKITTDDSTFLQKYFSGYPVTIDKTQADIDGSGTVTRRDLMILSRYLAGWSGYAEYFH